MLRFEGGGAGAASSFLGSILPSSGFLGCSCLIGSSQFRSILPPMVIAVAEAAARNGLPMATDAVKAASAIATLKIVRRLIPGTGTMVTTAPARGFTQVQISAGTA